MNDDIEVVLDVEGNLFVLKIGDRTIPMPPRQFEKLLEAALEAAARHVTASVRETGRQEPDHAVVHALAATGMDASADMGADTIVTKMRIGELAINFACPREIAAEYCAQVLECIQQADSAPPGQPN
jgi:hypothetical protein